MTDSSETRSEVQTEQADAPALPRSDGQVANATAAAQSGNAVELLPEFKVSGCFSSHMVLQRRKPVRVFGFSRHIGMKVTGSWEGETAESAVDADGRFTLEFSAREAQREGTKMIVASERGRTEFDDILVGDVWLIGGQSNAECHLEPCIRTTPELYDRITPEDNFRLFCQTQAKAYEFRDNCAEPAYDIIDPDWRWQRPDRDAALNFSAMGYYFAKELTKYTDVPLGLFMICAGGACLRELMPAELAVERGYTLGANMPVGGYYNTLISPLLGLEFYGQLFFQGESEGCWAETAPRYCGDLAAFVADERARFHTDFPFYNVQLCSYRTEGAQFFPYHDIVRLEQFDALGAIPDSYLAVCRDLGAVEGDPDWAHSPYKAELGRRLAMQVYAYEYGGKAAMPDPAEYESPVPVRACRVPEGIEVTFKYAGSGLETGGGGVLTGFGIRAVDCEKAQAAEAEIVAPDRVLVRCGEEACGAAAEVCFAYGFAAYMADANLVNSFGLPAPSFRIAVK